MDKKEELKGLLKELVQDEYKGDIADLQAKAATQEELNVKALEENTALKAQLDAMQDKKLTLNQNTGEASYIFKGYDTERPARNFKMDVSKEMGDMVAEEMVKALTSANTGQYAIPVEYSNALLGLAELSSVALSQCRIYSVGTNSLKIPAKHTRGAIDHAAFGTANTTNTTALRQIEFTIDKRIGSYDTLNNDLLMDQMFDVVGSLVEPQIAEAIGLEVDNQVFNSASEYTTNITVGGGAGVTVSGSTAIGAAITFDNLVTMAYAVELERGVKPQWYMPRGCMKDVVALVDSNGRPIFNPVPVSGAPGGSLLGYPIHIVTSLDNTPDDGAIRMVFGDMSQYIIAINGGVNFQVNPTVLMKEGQTQFIGWLRSDGNVVSSTAFATMKRTDA